MFLETFLGDSRELQGYLVSKRSSMGVSMEFKGSFKDILRKFQGCRKRVCLKKFKKSFKGFSEMFQ